MKSEEYIEMESYETIESTTATHEERGDKEPTLVPDAAKKYLSSHRLLVELILCASAFFLLEHVARFAFVVHERSAPYQVLENSGDVVLEQLLNFEVVTQPIPKELLSALVTFVPVGTIIVVGNMLGSRSDAHCSLCAFLLARGLSDVVTESVRRTVGYPRPNFYGLCGFNVKTRKCEGDRASISEAGQSFPSGHCSVSFSACTILTLFFLGKVRYNTHGPSLVPKKFYAFAAVVIPMGVATFVATSQVHSNWHHPADVVMGTIIGVACAVFSYSLWYPSIFARDAGLPYERIPR